MVGCFAWQKGVFSVQLFALMPAVLHSVLALARLQLLSSRNRLACGPRSAAVNAPEKLPRSLPSLPVAPLKMSRTLHAIVPPSPPPAPTPSW